MALALALHQRALCSAQYVIKGPAKATKTIPVSEIRFSDENDKKLRK